MIELVIYLIAFIISFIFQLTGFKIYSGIILILCAIFLYYRDVIKKKEVFNLRGLFSLGFLTGLGVSLFKLSNLSAPFENITWLCFFISYPMFYAGYEIIDIKNKRRDDGIIEERLTYVNNLYKSSNDTNALCGFSGILILVFIGITLVSFIIEAIILGFIPLFTLNTPHAYSYFHIFGLHYITVLYVFIPTFVCFYVFYKKKIDFIAALGLLYTIIMALLLVSRSSLLFSFILMMFSFLILLRKQKNFNLIISNKINLIRFSIIIIASVVILISLYVAVTICRAHSKEYLLGIFDLSNKRIPIFIAQPYTYIANNYENFNELVKKLPKFSFGLKGLYPLWTLSGLKFIFPQLVMLPMYFNKEELTTTTIIYDAYYDFGVFGVAIFMLLLGIISAKLMDIIRKSKNLITILLISQMSYYLLFSFFSCWFSLPQTFVYFVVTIVLIFIFEKFSKKFCRI